MAEISSPDKGPFALPDNGTYCIRNVHTGLFLDLKGNQPFEGATIQVYKQNNTTAQQWILRNQNQKGSSQDTCTLQSKNDQSLGNGFFAAKKQDSNEKILYTRLAWTISLIDGDNDIYRISYTRGKATLVLTAVGAGDPEVRLANRNEGDAKQQWQFQPPPDA